MAHAWWRCDCGMSSFHKSDIYLSFSLNCDLRPHLRRNLLVPPFRFSSWVTIFEFKTISRILFECITCLNVEMKEPTFTHRLATRKPFRLFILILDLLHKRLQATCRDGRRGGGVRENPKRRHQINTRHLRNKPYIVFNCVAAIYMASVSKTVYRFF